MKKVVGEFWRYCEIDERLTEHVSKDYKNIARRFLNHSDGIISKETIRKYLTDYLVKKPKTYNNQLDGIRAFVCRFLQRPNLINGFKKAHVPNNYERKLPSKNQLIKGVLNEFDRVFYSHLGTMEDLIVISLVRAIDFLYLYMLFINDKEEF